MKVDKKKPDIEETAIDLRARVHKKEDSAKKHRRSRNGCLTCRKRKKRCDEKKPTCDTCERLRLPCRYPSASESRGNHKFISNMEKVHSIPEDMKTGNGVSTPYSGFLQPSHGVQDSETDYKLDIASVESQLHFPLHYSVSKNGSPAPPPMDAGFANDEQSGNKTQNVMLNTPTLTDDGISHNDGANQPLFYDGAFGDFLSPMLVAAEAPAIPKNESLALFSPSIGQEGSNLTALDELTDPFASAVFASPPENFGDDKAGTIKAVNPNIESDTSIKLKPSSDDLPNVHTQLHSSAGPTTEKFKTVYPELDEKAVALFIYFRDKQSILMSVSPLNYFRSVFLAFSLRYTAIMYGILAWAAWHKGDDEELAREYFDSGSKIVRQESINSRSKEEILAALLVLASAKICSGDTSTWRPYLMMAGETIHLHGGLTSFMESESVRWLLKNFAYHEILTSSSLSQPKLFSAKDFELIFNQPTSAALPDTLCACCQPLFVILERINELTRAVRLMRAADGRDDENTERNAENIYIAAHDLEQRIWTLQPAHKMLQHLSERDLLLQQTLFDVFKLVTVLHMYQSVLQINSSSISMRVVAHHLSNTMESLFGTRVEGILTFPLFVLGISSSTAKEREDVVNKFTAMEKRLSARNVTQARVLLQRVWDRDQHGKLYVDWNELVDKDGLHFCFC